MAEGASGRATISAAGDHERRGRPRGIRRRDLITTFALIAALAALLSPTFVRARAAAGERACIANLKRIGLATGLYLQDYDETYPFAWGMPDGNQWFDTLAPYLQIDVHGKTYHDRVRNAPVFHCPSDAQGPDRISYATNALLSGAHSDDRIFAPERLAAVANPALVVWAGETNKNWTRKAGFADTVTDWVRPEMDLPYTKTDDRTVRFYRRWLKERDWTDLHASAMDCPDGLYLCKYPSFRHGRSGPKTGYALFVFVDGHVRACRWGQLNIENFFPYPTRRQLEMFNR